MNTGEEERENIESFNRERVSFFQREGRSLTHRPQKCHWLYNIATEERIMNGESGIQ